MRQKILLGCVLLFGSLSPLAAQVHQLTGKVTGEGANELPGVSIVVKGTQRGTVTDANGDYSLPLPAGESVTLTFSFLGYQSQDITPGAQTRLNVSLKPGDNALSEVVVVGYGTQRKKDLTGAISSIGARDVGGRQTLQVSDALQGSVAGVSTM
jgi:hypothetical protein